MACSVISKVAPYSGGIVFILNSAVWVPVDRSPSPVEIGRRWSLPSSRRQLSSGQVTRCRQQSGEHRFPKRRLFCRYLGKRSAAPVITRAWASVREHRWAAAHLSGFRFKVECRSSDDGIRVGGTVGRREWGESEGRWSVSGRAVNEWGMSVSALWRPATSVRGRTDNSK